MFQLHATSKKEMEDWFMAERETVVLEYIGSYIMDLLPHFDSLRTLKTLHGDVEWAVEFSVGDRHFFTGCHSDPRLAFREARHIVELEKARQADEG
jgi:hypothetical protein